MKSRSDSQKKYYQKNSEKIKAYSKARYHANKKKTEELVFLIGQFKWEIQKLTRITNILGFIALLNVATLLILSLTK